MPSQDEFAQKMSIEAWAVKNNAANPVKIVSAPWSSVYRVSLENGSTGILKQVKRPNPATFGIPEMLSRIAPGLCPAVLAAKPKRGFYMYEDLARDQISPAQELTRFAMLGSYGAIQAKVAADPAFLAEIPRHKAASTLDLILDLSKLAPDTHPGNVFALMDKGRAIGFEAMLAHHADRLQDMAALIDAAPATVNHTDLNTGNAHIRASGQICLIDWDDAILSAPGWSLHMPFSGAHAVLKAAQSLGDTSSRDQANFALRLYVRALERSGQFDGVDFAKLLPATAAFGVLKYATDMAPYEVAGTGMEGNIASFASRRLKDLGQMLDALEAAEAPKPRKTLVDGGIAFPEVQIKGPVATTKEIAKGAKLFRKNGALLIRDCVPPSLIAAVNAELEVTWAKHEAEIAQGNALRVGSKRYMISLSTEGALGQAEVLAASRITAICEQVLGSDMILGSLTTVVSLPGSEAQRWHCDNSDLFPENADLDTPAYSIAAIIPLIGLTPDIGATQVQPKSHRRGKGATDDLPYAIPDPGPGDCYLMDSRLMHRGLPNRSNVKRPILSLVYQRPWYKDYQNFNQQDALTLSQSVYDAFPADRQPLIKWALK